ncbi:MAG: FAS1-like dehydratase domain-containing protein [Sciscionella sp.]
MPLDMSCIGKSYPPQAPYLVSRAKIEEFADAIGDSNPLYRDPAAARAAGYDDVLAPPTMLTLVNARAIGALAADPELGLDYARMVHGDQSFVHHRALVAGDEIAVTTHIDNIMARAGNDFLTVRAEIATVTGEALCTATAQLVVRGEDQ